MDIMNKFEQQVKNSPEMKNKLQKGKIKEDYLPNITDRVIMHRRIKTVV